MVRDLAERERRPESRGRNKCRRNKDRKREGRKKEKSARKLGWGVVVCWGVGVGGCIPPHSLLSGVFGWAAEREGRWRVEERRGMERRGGAGVAFVCFPRFKASLEK